MINQALVRHFQPDEWPVYKVLRLRSLEDSPMAFGSTLDLESQRPDVVWAERLRNAVASEQDCVLLAEMDGAACGLVWAKADASDPRTANLYQMWVAPEARGHGLGDALLQAAIDWARQAGAHFVKLGVAVGDTPAARLYQRAGFMADGAEEPIRAGSAALSQGMVLTLL